MKNNKMNNANAKNSSTLIFFILIGIVSGIAGAILYDYVDERYLDADNHDTNELIKEYYDVENAVMVSPHGLRVKMDKGIDDFILVDLRSEEEYNQEHIIGAINIPAYKDKYTSAYDEKDRIIGSFKELEKTNKTIIVYCYSTPCMTGRKIGKMLADEGIYVQSLGIGWNEWRYFWTLWNHEPEWNITNVEDYIWKGSEPGVVIAKKPSGSVCTVGGYGC